MPQNVPVPFAPISPPPSSSISSSMCFPPEVGNGNTENVVAAPLSLSIIVVVVDAIAVVGPFGCTVTATTVAGVEVTVEAELDTVAMLLVVVVVTVAPEPLWSTMPGAIGGRGPSGLAGPGTRQRVKAIV